MKAIKMFLAQAGGTPPQGNSPTKTPPLSISPKAGISETGEQGREFESYYIVQPFASSVENSLQQVRLNNSKYENEDKTKLEESVSSFVHITQAESEWAPILSGIKQSPPLDERTDRVSVENGLEEEFNEDGQDHEQREQDVDIRVEDTATDVVVEVPTTLAPAEVPSSVERERNIDVLTQGTEAGNVEDNHTVDIDGPTDDRNEEFSPALLADISSTNLKEVQRNQQDSFPENLITGICIHRCVYCWPQMVHLQTSDHFVAIKKFIINRFVEVKVYMVPSMDYSGVCWHDIHIQVTVKGDMLNRIRLGVAMPEIATETTVYDTVGQVIGESPTVHETHRITDRCLNYSCSLINTAALQSYKKKKLKVKIDFRLYPNYALRTQLDHQDEMLVISRLNL